MLSAQELTVNVWEHAHELYSCARCCFHCGSHKVHSQREEMRCVIPAHQRSPLPTGAGAMDLHKLARQWLFPSGS